MAASLCPSNTQTGTSHSTMMVGSREYWDEYLQESLCKIPPAPLTSVIIEEITESPVDSRVPAPEKGQTMPAIKGFTPLVLALLVVTKPYPGFIQKGTFFILTIQDFDPLVLPRFNQGISRASIPKSLEATLPDLVIISPKMFSLALNLQTQ